MAIETVAVIGAGTMGHALALVHALGGCRVALHDRDEAVLARAGGQIAAACETLIDAGALDPARAAVVQDAITMAPALSAAVSGADLVVEAVVETAEVKRAVFDEIDRHAPEQAIIASNTSYLDIFPLVPEVRQPRAAIAHWYTPPYIVDLVDLAPGPATRPETTEALRRLYAGFGKVPLMFDRLVPGYVANRLQAALNLECLRMIEEGWADAEDIDLSIRHGLVHRLAVQGHMRKMDFTGLEMVRNGIASRMYQPPENTGCSPVLERLIAAGRTGIRSGAGFFDYGDTAPDVLCRDRDLRLLQLKAQLRDIMEGQESD
ncbi:3-hydroxyacyl-CoA dehydrogenase family protein [Tropicimonas sp. IMCC34043]|uniref:3-hydroxyacyl-CoA dehydrogenase family protein n=1 Tax=Tropicimonas sp. IMCC34043 TaxID=2248760 RepID=UPI0018E588FA|nr:3-hydroxyacyl-CoA dehydrogenase family protein [Tropicimonas sp. IMCC34043]